MAIISTRYSFILTIAIFVAAISLATTVEYFRIPDWSPANPANIISGNSRAPNQYRVLTPLIYSLGTEIINKPELVDRLVVFASILFCYIVCAICFRRSTRSLGIAMVCLLALLGSFQTGFMYRHRQEFWETGFLVLCAKWIHDENPNWKGFIFITFLGSLNRETWIFVIMAAAVCRIFHPRPGKDFPINKSDLIGLTVSFAIYTAVYVSVRYYAYTHYGTVPYYEFWSFEHNLANLGLNLNNRIWTLGAGLIWIYSLSVIEGNRRYLQFILGYLIPLLTVSFWISNWSEQRIFFPIYPVLIIASVEHFLECSQKT